MAGPLDGDIAKRAWRAAKATKLYKPATLIKVTPGTHTPGNISGGTNPTEASFKAAGFVADFSAYEMAQQLISVGDRKISLYGASIAGAQVPATDDKVTIDGGTYRIRKVGTDPAKGMYNVQTHGPAVPA